MNIPPGKLIKSPRLASVTNKIYRELYPTALKHPNQNRDDRKNQKNMNKPSHGIRRDKTEKPEDNEDDCNCSEHVSSPSRIFNDAG
jgi:hypothetical protein